MARPSEVKARVEARLVSIPGVVAVAADDARGVLQVFVESRGVCLRLPRIIDGVPVECVVVGRIRAFSPPSREDLKRRLGLALLLRNSHVWGVAPSGDTVAFFAERGEAAPSMVLGGYEVEVVRAGPFRALQLLALDRRRGVARPLLGGVSISNSLMESSAGTLTIVLTRLGRPLGLSNAHVIALDMSTGRWMPPGSPVQQPGTIDSGGPRRDLAVGWLAGWAPLRLGGPVNAVDLAWFTPEAGFRGDSVLGPGGEPVEVPWPWAAGPEPGSRACISGRTSGYACGTVTHVDALVKVDYLAAGYAIFDGQFMVRGVGASGDSGSPVLGEGHAMVGMLFAGSGSEPRIGIATPSSTVLSALESARRGSAATIGLAAAIALGAAWLASGPRP